MPDLDRDALLAGLVRPGLPWTTVRVVEQTGSTNADLATAGREGAASGTVLVAAEQTAGRGRLDRSWSSPPGTSLSVSYLVRTVRDDLGLLPLVTGLGVVWGLDRLGLAARLKWPNDVLLGEEKVCGILAEAVSLGPESAVVVGFGVNVSQAADELPVPWATSLAVAGVEVSREQAAVAVLTGVGEAVRTWLDRGWAPLAEAYGGRCATIGREVRVELTDSQHEHGTAVGVAPDGRLQVRVGDRVKAYASGDVHHLR